ncbi:hypothetical protein HMPREF9465_01254 [Sutterella wadsworthensis 2_1_59BFAA]|uniref:Uncharacterized protein n=1 Tax=Sutterella wadsworthensis 2_1_59BFAA TaxID=742823 RepID=K1KHF5_9BURK|nr:hypothetical protein HMPREF9465_01254 [Sutterella wadsworthensis 2_1_59BFAA]
MRPEREYRRMAIVALDFIQKYATAGKEAWKGVSGFLCLGRLFQGQPNEAALCFL